ncbi:hypothetical protein SteCoe_772 [Stentor coeruleus]|uniref:Methyltransferase small domain-containing protein n=1 Tax=Stentor coeruleus TaxID=5963 RepID=A0A1R2D362_9CILI|nr:hypothetical protein SteCoe_772 [Stentor coeruleus]
MNPQVIDMNEEQEFDDYRYANYKQLAFPQFTENTIIIEQDFRIGKCGILWDSSYVLTKFINELPLENKTILELGAGTALPSILAAYKGARIYTTDIKQALNLTNRNISLNESIFKGSVNVRELDWSVEEHRRFLDEIYFDYVFLSDLFNLPDLAKDLKETLKRSVKENTIIVACYKYRIPEIVEPFLEFFTSDYHLVNLDLEVRKFHKNPDLRFFTAKKLNYNDYKND